MCVVKAMESLAGHACKASFDKREFRTKNPFFILEKGLCSNQLLCFLSELSFFKKHVSKKAFHRSDLAKIKNKFYSAFSSSFRLFMPITLIEKQNNSKLVLHLGSREKMWQS